MMTYSGPPLPACGPTELGSRRGEIAARQHPQTCLGTLTVLRDHTQYRVRLHGIGASERGQPFATKAKQFASELAFGRSCGSSPPTETGYERIVADVILPDGRNVNRELVPAGAWETPTGQRDYQTGARDARDHL
jgi:endonuclease YncB( thermonuclease family)